MKRYIRDSRSPIPRSENVSRVMSANRAKNTVPETRLRKALRGIGISGYRLNPNKIIGRPDIVFSKEHVAIFVHGCFWHRCPKCAFPLPKSNIIFWKEKFKRNKARDNKKLLQLKAAKWKVLVIWEHEIKKNPAQAAGRILNVLKKRQS